MNNTRINPFYQFCLLLVLSIGLMILDNKTSLFQPVKTIGSIVRRPFELVVGIQDLIPEIAEEYYDGSVLREKHERLEKDMAVLRARLQRYDAIKAENERLGRLLSASVESSDEFLLANIVTSNIEPFNHKIVIDRGLESGVFAGQPAVSPDGVLGQIIEVGYRRSVVMLLSDVGHGLPVQVLRNGLLTIAVGTGKPDEIRLPYLELEADLRMHDLLVTSGMGNRFPAGYHVGTVTEVLKDTSQPFLNVTVKTSTRANYTKDVLLLWRPVGQGPGDRQEANTRGE